MRSTFAGVGAVVVSIALAAGGCRMAPHERHTSGDPDKRLAEALADLDMARAEGVNNQTLMKSQSVIVDPDGIRLRLERLANDFPNHTPTLTMCANLAYDAGEHEKAAQYCDRILSMQPENNFAAIIRSRIALEEGNLPRAQTLLERQLTYTPESPYVHEVLASVYFYKGEFNAAEREIVLAERYGSEASRTAFLRGLLAEKNGRMDDARRYYAESLKIEPGFEPAQSHLSGIDGMRAAPAPK